MLEKSMAPPLPQRPSPSGTPFGGTGLGFAAASSSRSPSVSNISNIGNIGGNASGVSGAPVSSPFAPRLSAQHERLMLELLPFKDAAQFREWLGFLEGDWDEYCRDYLEPQYHAALYDGATGLPLEIPGSAPDDPEPDKTTTASRAKDAINSQSVQFLAYHPLAQDKQNWTPEDHAVRFLVTAIADSLLRKVWQERDWRKRPVEIARAVYEVLSYKREGYAEYQLQLWVQRQQQRQLQAAQGGKGHGGATTAETLSRQHNLPARRGASDNLMDSPPEYNY
ncbi:hypothetical protein F503_06530 [Ophiostoma piceae UAMH 11346]|uniref:Uncharacterized protein n=1 Tax=Ophiostoma piceae (strain UAMH 11346) TaxID=1262450 RepID=S3CP23_OPHP1|nr:hypothetical protein F503_06530 [Ophiostoma piceae UAMH 11346]